MPRTPRSRRSRWPKSKSRSEPALAPPHREKRRRNHAHLRQAQWLRHGGDERAGIIVAERLGVLLHLPQRSPVHSAHVAIAPVEKRKRAAQRAVLRIERQVDQHVVVEV